jgi:hypothetical protein
MTELLSDGTMYLYARAQAIFLPDCSVCICMVALLHVRCLWAAEANNDLLWNLNIKFDTDDENRSQYFALAGGHDDRSLQRVNFRSVGSVWPYKAQGYIYVARPLL